jgi:hypothetical protein
MYRRIVRLRHGAALMLKTCLLLKLNAITTLLILAGYSDENSQTRGEFLSDPVRSGGTKAACKYF